MPNNDRVVDAASLTNGLLKTIVARLLLYEPLQVFLRRLRIAGSLQLKSNSRVIRIQANLGNSDSFVRDTNILSRYNNYLIGPFPFAHANTPLDLVSGQY